MTAAPADKLNALLPAHVDSVRAGHGSFIDLYMSAPSGKLVHAWIYQCDWTLLNGDDAIASSAEFDKDLVCRYLSDTTLTQIVNTANAPDLDFLFEDGSILRLTHDTIYDGEDMVIFYLPDELTISFNHAIGFYEE